MGSSNVVLSLLPNSRSDLEDAVNMLKEGKSMNDVLENFPASFVRYHRGFQAVKTLSIKPRSGRPTIEIYWGPSGTGKSRKAFDENPDAYVLAKPCSDGKLWWDHYEGQTTVIIDEFYGWIKYDLLLRILDYHPLMIPIKGGYLNLAATKFVFTSNTPWQEWYHLDTMPLRGQALKRRIEEFGTVTHMADRIHDESTEKEEDLDQAQVPVHHHD